MIHDKEELERHAEDDGTFSAPVKTKVVWYAVIEFCKDGDGHFFDDDTMRFFDSELHGIPRVGVDGHIYAVVSSKGPHSPRTYQVVRVTSEGNTHRPHVIGEGGARVYNFTILDAAEGAQDELVRGKVPSDSWSWY